MSAFQKKILVGLIVLAALSPLGIILPEKFQAGDAWGEWSVEVLQKTLGFAPRGLKRDADIYQAPVPEYGQGDDKSSFTVKSASYILSAVIGLAACAGICFVLFRLFGKKE